MSDAGTGFSSIGQIANGVYFDVALSWVISDVATCPVELREEGERPSGYNYRSLMSHFWRMVLTGGTRLTQECSRTPSDIGIVSNETRGIGRRLRAATAGSSPRRLGGSPPT